MDDLTWFENRIVAFKCGLLSTDDEARFRELIQTNTECRDRIAALESDSWADDGHLAPAVLARWPRYRAAIDGIELEMVESHLSRCDSCRQELVLLGFEQRAAPETASHPAHVIRPLRVIQRRSVWDRLFPRVALGWGALATAACILLLLRPSTQVPGGLSLSAPIHARISTGATRSGEEQDPTLVLVPPGARVVELRLDPLSSIHLEALRASATPEGTVAVAVTNPGGDVVMQSVPLANFVPPTSESLKAPTLWLGNADDDLVEGDYVLEILEAPTPGSAPILDLVYRFKIQRTP